MLTLGLLAGLIAIIAFAVTRLPTGTAPRPAAAVATRAPSSAPAGAAAPAPSLAGATPADTATQQAIQTIIQQLDNAQAQAIATGDEQVMAATATPEFYQLQVATNQDLVANGVTEVQLLNLEWGDISVSGDSAIATVYETWSTTFDDGTTEQARDRNVYLLFKDATRGWIVVADDHPDQAAGAQPTPRPTN
ncbi:MAG TPA: hypothetical protein VGQ62_11475 [Chloroflexota bacterium]|nr:hypothetical protein [Chloroflexota bacterium]